LVRDEIYNKNYRVVRTRSFGDLFISRIYSDGKEIDYYDLQINVINIKNEYLKFYYILNKDNNETVGFNIDKRVILSKTIVPYVCCIKVGD